VGLGKYGCFKPSARFCVRFIGIRLKGKHLFVSAVIALFLELVLLIALAVLPIQILGQTVIAVSMPLGVLLVHVLPDGFA
jgi:hypothetical protein